LVEQFPFKEWVDGSSPSRLTSYYLLEISDQLIDYEQMMLYAAGIILFIFGWYFHPGAFSFFLDFLAAFCIIIALKNTFRKSKNG
jgi:hypothetical protein